MSPISPTELRSVVTAEDDFGHEVRVGNAIHECPAIEVQHGGTYTDLVTQKPRQFDYRCLLRQEEAMLSLAVECKNLSPSAPLVICGLGRREDETFHHLIESQIGLIRREWGVIDGLWSTTRRANGEDAFYEPSKFVGKSLVRIQTSKKPMAKMQDSDVYDKWAQALSSAVDLAQSACNYAQTFQVARFLTAVIPAVVVPDGVLWRMAYDANGGVSSDPAQIDACELFIGREIEVGGEKGTPYFHRYTFSHVHFFTLTGFGSFLSKMTVNSHAWNKLFTDQTMEV